MGKIFKSNIKKNIFCEMTNEDLQKCYKGYQRYMIAKEYTGIWEKSVNEYKKFINCDEYPKAADSLCKAHMFEEIAHRFFKIVNMSSDLCELFGIKK